MKKKNFLATFCQCAKIFSQREGIKKNVKKIFNPKFCDEILINILTSKMNSLDQKMEQ